MTTRQRSVVVRGSGVAGLTIARLLDLQGWSTVPAPSVAIDASELARRLAASLRLAPASGDDVSDAAWIVDARSISPQTTGPASPMHAFGRRHARVAQAMLRAASRPDTCVIETVRDGWVFLLPAGAGGASLQFVSIPSITPIPAPNEAVAATRTIRKAIDSIGAWSDPMPCMPRIRLSPARPGRIAIGEAALGFDPISGDGVGHALRGTVLAATLLHGIANGTPIAECLDGYAYTLRRAMTHHLKTCLGLYAYTPDWCDELSAMASGVALLTGQAISQPT